MMTVHLQLILQLHQLLQLVVVSVLLKGCQAQQPQHIPAGWESFPLTVKEVGLLAADLTRTDSIRTTNPHNQTCLISPLEGPGPGSCTWRSERRCKRVPTARTVPVFSPWCSNTGTEGHLTRCRDKVEKIPLVSRVKVCTPTGVPDCRGPCYNCEDYCEPVQQTWCELEHTISTRTEVRTACHPGEDTGQWNSVQFWEIVTFTESCFY